MGEIITPDVISMVERLGSIGLLLLLVWRLPSIIEKFHAGTHTSMAKVQEIQTAALLHSDRQIEKLLAHSDKKFEAMEKSLKDVSETTKDLVDATKELVIEMKTVKGRVEVLERGSHAPR